MVKPIFGWLSFFPFAIGTVDKNAGRDEGITRCKADGYLLCMFTHHLHTLPCRVDYSTVPVYSIIITVFNGMAEKARTPPFLSIAFHCRFNL